MPKKKSSKLRSSILQRLPNTVQTQVGIFPFSTVTTECYQTLSSTKVYSVLLRDSLLKKINIFPGNFNYKHVPWECSWRPTSKANLSFEELVDKQAKYCKKNNTLLRKKSALFPK